VNYVINVVDVVRVCCSIILRSEVVIISFYVIYKKESISNILEFED